MTENILLIVCCVISFVFTSINVITLNLNNKRWKDQKKIIEGLKEENKEIFCDCYCKYSADTTISQTSLKVFCEVCPLNTL